MAPSPGQETDFCSMQQPTLGHRVNDPGAKFLQHTSGSADAPQPEVWRNVHVVQSCRLLPHAGWWSGSWHGRTFCCMRRSVTLVSTQRHR